MEASFLLQNCLLKLERKINDRPFFEDFKLVRDSDIKDVSFNEYMLIFLCDSFFRKGEGNHVQF